MIGVIILNYKNWKVTIECVASIMESKFSEDIYILLIDNGSKNESVDRLEAAFHNNKMVHIIKLPENLGFAKGNNIGIKKCKEKGITYCLLVNSDVILKKDTISLLYVEMLRHKDAVIIGPGVKGEDNQRMPSSRLSSVRIIDALEIGRWIKTKSLNEDEVWECTRVYSVSGCCFLIDINKFIELSAFDEATFLYNEENILGALVERSNYSIYIYPRAEVIHKHAASSGGGRNDFVSIEYIKSSLYYYKTYQNMGKGIALVMVIIYFIKMAMLSLKYKCLHPYHILKVSIQEWRGLYGKGE